MDVKLAGAVENLWNPEEAEGLSPLESLAYRSNLLGSDRSVANYGGGNTSSKATERDHTGREIEVLWVKGSGGDLADIKAEGFTGLKLEEISPLMERDEMSDEEMVAYLSRCQLDPAMPRSSIETLIHAFVPCPHVDHTHADATNMICAAENGEELAKECFGDEAIWIPYIRPGFTLSKQVGEAVRNNPGAKLVLLAKHGLVTWGDSSEESYNNTIRTINRAAEFVAEKSAGREPFGGRRLSPVPPEQREEFLAAVLPTLRGAVSGLSPKILRADTSEDVIEFVCGGESSELSQVGAACPDHLVQTKVRPLWVEFDPEREGAAELREKLLEGAGRYRQEYDAYFSRYQEESYAVEYWPLELYKLTLAPPPEELEGRVAFVTGGAGGIGGAVARALATKGACVAVADLDADGAAEVAQELDTNGKPVRLDVTDEAAVAAAYRETVLAYGGVDAVGF